jgi:hypothetical protein
MFIFDNFVKNYNASPTIQNQWPNVSPMINNNCAHQPNYQSIQPSNLAIAIIDQCNLQV